MSGLRLFTLVHTAISLVAITAGIMVLKGLIESNGRQLWTLLFLCAAALGVLAFKKFQPRVMRVELEGYQSPLN